MTSVDSPHRALKVLEAGEGAFHPVDVDGFREWVRDHKDRSLTPRLMTEREAVERFVDDGDYLAYDCNYIMRGPNSLLNEIIRQKKKELWLCGKFTYVDVSLLVGAGVANRIDCGFFIAAPNVQRGVRDGSVTIHEYSNVIMTLRLRAGAMGVSFLPVRSFGGTTGFVHSGARLIEDPYTGDPTVVVPALNPDVAIVHVNQADIYGNARVFGTGIAHVESALASRKVIISAEEIIDTEEIRRNPGLTSIPYYAVDAVVEAPHGAYPGTCPGYYSSDSAAVMEIFQAIRSDTVGEYIEKWITPFETHAEMLHARVGVAKLLELRSQESIREGYHP